MARQLLLLCIVPLLFACATQPPVPLVGGIVRTDHHVRVESTAPGMNGATTDLYVREVSWPGVLSTIPAPQRVVLFVHGSGTPGEVAFDVPYADFSWMEYLAHAGFDVFAMDMTGYGRSTRPPAMNDACNFPKAQQPQFVPVVLAAPCPPSHSTAITTLESDWNDIGAVVDYLRRERGVEQVAMVGWSQGGPRIAGYVLRNPGKVSRIFALAPAYTRDMAGTAPDPAKTADGQMGAVSHDDFTSGWIRQVGCNAQYQPATGEAIWKEMLASDPVASTWGPGVRRAPNVTSWGFNKDAASRINIPFAMATGQHDKQVAPERVNDLYDDLATPDKVLIDLACSSHNAMWEGNHLLLFKASAEWLRDGRVAGLVHVKVRLGY
jgi:pimeloyl-ACP methyl ester carboxylesterase